MAELDEICVWFAKRIPAPWFVEEPVITIDRDEILVVGRLSWAPVSNASGSTTIVKQFRDDTRAERTSIARDAEREFGRRVSWGIDCDDHREIFTTLGLPIMTRLHLEERAVLDALIDAGVARSRSQALAWCVRLVGQHESEWIQQLKEALEQVEKVRAEGPAPAQVPGSSR
ncbi:MAG: hypothetical protein NVS2B16_02690 [Chloroflexota bacterium]